MVKISICRICMAENVPGHKVIDPHLQDIYELLTNVQFQSDVKTTEMCNTCREQLEQVYQLRELCLRNYSPAVWCPLVKRTTGSG